MGFFFTIYHVYDVTVTIWTNFRSPIFEFILPRCYRGEDVWKRWRTDGRRAPGSYHKYSESLFCFLQFFVVCFALRPKSTAMVMAGRSLHLNTLFPGQVNQYFVYILSLVTENNPSWMIQRKEENDRRNYFIISTKVWDQAGIELATPESAVRLAFVARHVTDCTTRPGIVCRE